MPEPAKNLTALKQSKKSLVAMGKNILIYINVGTDETTGAKWELLGGQRTGDLNLKADSIDASHKGTGGWKTTLPGMKEWSTEVESILMLNDETLKVVYQAFLNDERIHIKYEYPDKKLFDPLPAMVGNRESCTSNQKKRYRRLEKDKQPTQRPGSIAL